MNFCGEGVAAELTIESSLAIFGIPPQAPILFFPGASNLSVIDAAMNTIHQILTRIAVATLMLCSTHISAQTVESRAGKMPAWYLSFQYLGLTYHPDGGNTPEVYPLKLDKKAYFVLDVGVVANVDYCLSENFFLRFTTSLYKDCAFVTAGCVHAGPRLQFSWGDNRINAGVGPILSFRGDWHRFGQYKDDEFYGNRVYKGWQYRFFLTAIEFEYLRRINDSMEFQYSIIPGAPLVITSIFGIRFRL
jgi:hypothetical protein